MTLSVLVTGGAGYVGSHMLRALLREGHAAVAFDSLERGHRDAVPPGHLVEGSLLDPGDIQRAFQGRHFDVVMHFAAYCYVGESVDRPLEYYRNNFCGTLNLLDAMRKNAVSRIVFSSTCSTYGNPQKVPIDEDHPQQPINPYGASKLAVERLLRELAGSAGLDSVSLRYFNAAGSDPEGRLGECHDPETHLIPLALLEALRVRAGGDPSATNLTVHGSNYDTADGTCVRDYVHVNDLASAHLLAAAAMVDGRLRGAHAFNLGTDRGASVLQVIDTCRRVSGVPFQYRIGPRRPGDPSQLVASSAAARRVLGWKPTFAHLDTIVETAWTWFSTRQATPATDLL